MSRTQRVCLGACAGALAGSIPIGRLHGWGRVAYAAVPGVLGAVAMGLHTQETPAVRLRLALLLGGAGAAGQNLGIVVDRAVEGWLRRHGVRRPRLVLAGVGTVYGALTFGKDATRHSDGKA